MSPKAAKKAASAASKSVEVGDEIEAKCGKCRKVTPHVVRAKIEWRPTRVECKVCKARHEYRAPAKTERKEGASRAAAPELSPEDRWRKVMEKASGTARKYDRTETYAVGSKIKHPKFGEGVVTALPSHTVCEVTFEGGVKKLLMASRRTPPP